MANLEQLESRRLFAAGFVDPTFGARGTIIVPDSNSVFLNRPFPAVDGGLFVYTAADTGNELVRLLPDGSIVPGFTQTGLDVGSLQVQQDTVTKNVALLIGGDRDADSGFALRVLHSDGTPDIDFGDHGFLKLNQFGFTGGAFQYDASGRLVLVQKVSHSTDIRITRLTATGELDPEFGGDGSVRLKLSVSRFDNFGIDDEGNFTLFATSAAQGMRFRIADDGTPIGQTVIKGSRNPAVSAFTLGGDCWFIDENRDVKSNVRLCFLKAGTSKPIVRDLGALTNFSLAVDNLGQALMGSADPKKGLTTLQRFGLKANRIVRDEGYGINGQYVPAQFHSFNPFTTGEVFDVGPGSITRISGGTDATPGNAELSKGVLTVSGTTGDDNIVINRRTSRKTFVVHANAFSKSFPISSVTAIKVLADKGDDAVAIDPALIGTSVDGSGGHDTLIGGNGNDSITGGINPDTIIGLAGNDVLSGGGGDDYVLGNVGKDSLAGNGGSDTLVGGPGNDQLFGGPLTSDTLNGGSGFDTGAQDAMDTYHDVEKLI